MSPQEDLIERLKAFRRRIEPAFGQDTALRRPTGAALHRPSSGHCAVVSAIVREAFGGELASATVQGESHWFNRMRLKDGALDIDLTGDQFGFESLRVAPMGRLYEGTRLRLPEEMNVDTLRRSVVLAERAGLADIASRLRSMLARRLAVPARYEG